MVCNLWDVATRELVCANVRCAKKCAKSVVIDSAENSRAHRPTESQYVARGNFTYSRGPLQAASPRLEGTRGPSDIAGPGVAYPVTLSTSQQPCVRMFLHSWAAQPRGVGGHCPPTFEAKGVQGVQWRWCTVLSLGCIVVFVGVVFYFICYQCLNYRGAGGFPHRGCGPPNNTRRRSLGAFGASASSSTAFFLVRPLFVIKYLYWWINLIYLRGIKLWMLCQ